MKSKRNDGKIDVLLTPLSSYIDFVKETLNDKFGETTKLDKVQNCPFLREGDDLYDERTVLFGIS